MPKKNDEFGLLTVVDTKKGFCECVCICGNTLTVKFWKLTGAGGYKPLDNCGCLQKNRSNNDVYSVWCGMKRRCYQSNSDAYKNYGGRGIKICDRWLNSFPTFLKDMGVRPDKTYSIDRIDNNGHYEPGNCRWATATEQANNTRKNHFITFNYETNTLTQWARILDMHPSVLRSRLKRGWSIEKTLSN